jgi:predicted small secreted protein
MLEMLLFNTMNLNNDLTGTLKGSVMFAQSTIMPSPASAIPGDVQPRLTSLKDTLVMLKPLTGSLNYANGVQVSVQDKNTGKVLYTAKMKKPEELPPVAGGGYSAHELAFIEPAKYDYTIRTQAELKKLENDKNGAYLTTLLKTHKTIKIAFSDGNWISEIFIPSGVKDQDKKLIVIEHNASYQTKVNYAGKMVKTKKNTKLALKHVQGAWKAPIDIANMDGIKIFAIPDTYKYTVNTNAEMKKMEAQQGTAYIANLFKSHDSINVRIAPFVWAGSFNLPEKDASLHGKRIVFESISDWKSTLNYGNGRSVILRQGDTYSFMNIKGEWVEWNDVQYSKIAYSDALWSASIPWKHVTPNMKVVFTIDKTTGEYKNINVGGASELLLHTIVVGMLTPNDAEFILQNNPEYQRQYLQQVPLSRLIVNTYEPVHLKEVVLPDGKTHTTNSSVDGGVYTGDMRENIAKELISLGINAANYGIYSGSDRKFMAGQMTAHHAIGKYKNGIVKHGLSGGASMVTLLTSIDNEFSHEVGHNYGLPHYPGGFDGSVHRPSGQKNSTWGWDSKNNVFLPNFSRQVSGVSACVSEACQGAFHGHAYGFDAMAGGGPFVRQYNQYTLHTPYSLNKIQSFMEKKAVFSKDSPTGYKMWNEQSKTMANWSEHVLAKPEERNLKSMTALLNANRVVEISQYNGYYVKDIYLPAASSTNKDKEVHIVHEASFDANLHINGAVQVLKNGAVQTYISDGKKWNLNKGKRASVARNPKSQGVKVTTLVGYYDPQAKLKSYIYPALHAGYGNEFASDRAAEIAASVCHAEILNKSKKSLKFVLQPVRINAAVMNNFHINVPTSFGAVTMNIRCNGKVIATRALLPPAGGAKFNVVGQGS